jgi:hypothetical protein
MIALMDRFTHGRTDANGPPMAGLLSSAEPATSFIERGDMRARGAAAGSQP